MKNFFNTLYRYHALVYKVGLYILTVLLIVYVFPKGGKFPYEFQKGKPWQYETLVAPFNFQIEKSKEELAQEQQEIREKNIPYFIKSNDISEIVATKIQLEFNELVNDTVADKPKLEKSLTSIVTNLYEFGVLDEDLDFDQGKGIFIKSDNSLQQTTFDKIVLNNEIRDVIFKQLIVDSLVIYQDQITSLVYDNLKSNLSLSETLTNNALEEQIAALPEIHGVQEKGFKIIAKGEVVEGLKLNKLNSLRSKYESQTWSKSNYNWIVFGYLILVSLILMMLFLFLKKYRNDIFENNTKVTFILFNITLMIILTSLAVKYDTDFIYVVPMCILPLILKAFFDARLGLFSHVVAVLIVGFIVPDSFEYVFLQIVAGIVTILTVSEIHKRVNLFISVGQIVSIYILASFAFYIIKEGDIVQFLEVFKFNGETFSSDLRWDYFIRYILSGAAMLLVQPLIYIYEKFFGLVSDVSLLELSDTNSKLLKKLENEAPGTFHHSLNVANLAEAVANEIGANTMLVRVGALYHDIGKMKNSLYFTENQKSSSSLHDELSPKESAQIIIDHVIHGIELAKKFNLPDRVIDFIRTHHGTTTVYYFYKTAQDEGVMVKKEDFQYPGPAPFSKETAILMMCDSVEAASKSLKEPNSVLIDEFVEKIISKQVNEGQFLNANITFKEIEIVKKVLKKKLNHIYHLRIEYPD
ncbi:MAG: HDIG domain-containing protein [Flavobacteriaceae bacterium]|nr:HDIG domain-containing protein [Flavobacteriaceae bacterium]